MIRVLYVEDDSIAGKIGMSTLSLFKEIETTLAVTGYEAIDSFNNYEYDLLIVDLGLPDISGLEMVQIIRKQNKAMPPVVVVTAHMEPSAAAPDGIERVYAKPLTYELIQEILNVYVQTS